MRRIFYSFLSFLIYTSCIDISEADEKSTTKGAPRIDAKIDNAEKLSFDLYCNGFYIFNENTQQLSDKKHLNQYLKNENNVIQLVTHNYPYKDPTSATELTISVTASLKTLFTGKIIINAQTKRYVLRLPDKYDGIYLWQNAEHLKSLNDSDTLELKKISSMYIDCVENGTPGDISGFFAKYYAFNCEFYTSADTHPKPDKQTYEELGDILYDVFGKGGGENRTIESKASIENIIVELSPFDDRVVVVKEKSRKPVLNIKYVEDGDVLSVLIDPALNFIYYNNGWQLY